jgi:hypothetical protein
MTFIASVIAKKGAIIIADSLATTEMPILHFQDYFDFLKQKKRPKKDKLKIDPMEIRELFRVQPTYTKDFQEKLFKYDHYTAITIAGTAGINEKKIEAVIEEARIKFDPDHSGKTIDEKVEEFRLFMRDQAVEHLSKHSTLRTTIFIITHYNPTTHITRIFKVITNRTDSDDFAEDPSLELVSLMEQPKEFTVVCDGQNRISERILFGDIDTISYLIPRIVEKVLSDFKIKKSRIPPDYISNLTKSNDLLPDMFFEDIKMSRIKELSMQQAHDLACLLMRIERDIQQYTENIPTVGGVVKIAQIDDKGFKFLTEDIDHKEKF